MTGGHLCDPLKHPWQWGKLQSLPPQLPLSTLTLNLSFRELVALSYTYSCGQPNSKPWLDHDWTMPRLYHGPYCPIHNTGLWLWYLENMGEDSRFHALNLPEVGCFCVFLGQFYRLLAEFCVLHYLSYDQNPMIIHPIPIQLQVAQPILAMVSPFSVYWVYNPPYEIPHVTLW